MCVDNYFMKKLVRKMWFTNRNFKAEKNRRYETLRVYWYISK